MWTNEFGEKPYRYYEPKETRLLCKELIPKFSLKHEETHSCKNSSHRCYF